PGNSGGPLFDVSGRLVGINTAIVGESYRGVSFAIPSSVAQNVFERLVRDGAVAHGWLGVQLVDLDDEQSERLGTAPRAGAYVAGFVDDPEAGPSPARLAGLQAGDIVLQWDTRAVGNRAELSRLVAQSDAGATARLTVERNGEQVAVDVQLGQRPSRFN
ncbi:MAG: PDZ domain-containing protein, partial [Planctomycetales bacterium]|nr:PDZ domain-containing protein [Planctomycetales bacterium]